MADAVTPSGFLEIVLTSSAALPQEVSANCNPMYFLFENIDNQQHEPAKIIGFDVGRKH